MDKKGRSRSARTAGSSTSRGILVVQETLELPQDFFKPGKLEAMINDTMGQWTLWSAPSRDSEEEALRWRA